MDLRQYRQQMNRKEASARSNCEWLIGQFGPEEDRICARLSWEADTPIGYLKIIGEIIVAMLFSSGYWASYNARTNPRPHLRFRVSRMTPEEYQRAVGEELEDSDDEEEKIDEPTASETGTEHDGRISSQD